MKTIVTIKNMTFTYAGRQIPTLKDINYTIQQGDFILLTGTTGCGKSTLLKTLNGLIPQESGGTMQGTVYVDGVATHQINIADVSRLVGLVFQNPEDQIFSATVEDETAFVLENMGLPETEIRQAVSEALDKVGLADKRTASIHALSGGQKQRLAVAAVLAAKPEVLALDEPISQLDPVGAESLLQVLTELNRQGITIIVVEHRLHEVLPVCSRITIMDEGVIVWDGPAGAALSEPDIFVRHGLRLPQPLEICHALGIVTVGYSAKEAVDVIRQNYKINPVNSGFIYDSKSNIGSSKNQPSIQVNDLVFGYSERDVPVLQGVDFTAFPGEVIALMGTNGAGKSTLLQHIAGLVKPWQGNVLVHGLAASIKTGLTGMVLQNSDLMLFNTTVAEEISFGCRYNVQKVDRTADASDSLAGLLTDFDLIQYIEDFPLALSRGQRLRVAIASVLACCPAVLLLDEPTTGQDISHIRDIEVRIRHFAQAGGTVIFSTHDGELAARLAERIVVMKRGEIIMDSHPAKVFCRHDILQQASLKVPPVIEMAGELGLGPLLKVEEVVNYVRQSNVGSNNQKYCYAPDR